MRFRRDVQHFVGVVGVVVDPEAVGTGLPSQGSVGNVVSAVVVMLSYRISRTFSPSENEVTERCVLG
jgi:hypothetical protein